MFPASNQVWQLGHTFQISIPSGAKGSYEPLISALRDIPALPIGNAKIFLQLKSRLCQLAVFMFSYIAVLAKISNSKLPKLPFY